MPPTPELSERFELRIPAEADHLATARLFAATVARSMEIDDETIEDLKLAVSELVSAVAVNHPGTVASIDIDAAPGTLEVSVGPIAPDDMIDEVIDPIDIVVAVFPETRRGDSTIVIAVTPEDVA